jgi:hypothetical protein
MKEISNVELYTLATEKVAPFLMKMHALKYPKRHDKQFALRLKDEEVWLPSIASVELDPTKSIQEKAHDIAPEFRPIGRHIASSYVVRRALHLREFIGIHADAITDDTNQIINAAELLPDPHTLEDMITQIGERNRSTCKSLEEHVGQLLVSQVH